MMQFSECLDKCQPDSSSMFRILCLIEPIEDIGLFVVRNTCTVVAYRYSHLVSFHGCSKGNFAPVGRVLHCIGQEVIADTLQLVMVGTHG